MKPEEGPEAEEIGHHNPEAKRPPSAGPQTQYKETHYVRWRKTYPRKRVHGKVRHKDVEEAGGHHHAGHKLTWRSEGRSEYS